MVRDSDGPMATRATGPGTRWTEPADGGHAEPVASPWPGPGFGFEPVLGREVSRIDWQSTLYYWLNNSLYVNAEGMRAGQYELSSGTNQLKPPRMFTDALHSFGPGNYWEINTYSGPLGDTSLRDAVVNYENTVNDWRLTRENVAITYGAHEGLQVALKAIRPHGKRTALVLGPQVPLVFQALLQEGFSFTELWSGDGRAVVPSATEVLDGIARCAPAVVLLTSPNNPTGAVYRDDELAAIGAAAIDRGCGLVVDKILSDSSLPGSPMASGTCARMGQWIDAGRCLVVDSLSKRRAISGLRAGYLLASAEIVANHSMSALGGCPPLLLATAAAADLNCSARLHAATAGVADADRVHADDLSRMRATVERNFDVARNVLEEYWVWDSKQPGRFNCVVGLRVGPTSGDDREKCKRLFNQQVTCYPLSTFAADQRLMDGRDNASLLETRLTCAMEPARFEETMLRTRCALQTLHP